MSLGILAGCAGNKELIRTASTGTNQKVFQELGENLQPAAPGYVDLRIYASLKTHHPGAYSASDIHGTPYYKMIVNIDGQVTELERQPAAGNRRRARARRPGDPEAGDGMRYQFSRNLRIKAGPHKIAIAIPAEGIVIEREIFLAEGRGNNLTLEPVYGVKAGKKRLGVYGENSFKEGIRGFKIVVNGQVM